MAGAKRLRPSTLGSPPCSRPVVTLRRMANPLVDLPTDVLDQIVQQLDLFSLCALRQVCWGFSKLRLPEGMLIALQVLRERPSLPEKYRTGRVNAMAALTKTWSMKTYSDSRAWRLEWTGVAAITDALPTAALIKAHSVMPGFGESKCLGLYRELVSRAIEDRMWEVCCSEDRYKSREGCWVVKKLSDEEATRLVAQMLENVGLWYGSTAFWHTINGRYGYTPFLLAAEQHNLPLVEYLHREWGDHSTIHARTRQGNNAYSLCLKRLQKNGYTAEEIEESEVLRYLVHKGVEMQEWIELIDVDATNPWM